MTVDRNLIQAQSIGRQGMFVHYLFVDRPVAAETAGPTFTIESMVRGDHGCMVRKPRGQKGSGSRQYFGVVIHTGKTAAGWIGAENVQNVE